MNDKSYNPFTEIIEKQIGFIFTEKLISEGYKNNPLGFSSDLTFENQDHIINIDIKSANLNNTADFKDLIPLGFSQTSYSGK